MTEMESKRCVVAYATKERQYQWTVELHASATVAEALDAARRVANLEHVPWEDSPVGIYGEPCGRDIVPADGDRIEIYRPLQGDPRERRRERVRRQRTSPSRSGG